MSLNDQLTPITELPEFVPKEPKKKPKRKRRHLLLKVLAVFAVVLIGGGLLFSYRVLSVSRDVFVSDDTESSFIGDIKRLFVSEDKLVAGQADGRTNILLMGMGGEGHTGAYLTDTIMIASISYNDDNSVEDVAFISIPRDLYVPHEYGKSKINSVFATGERNQEGSGAEYLSQTVSNITDIPIHYYVRVDFEGFKKIVDSLGGITVDVERSFIDTEYPTYNFGYQTVEFESGLQKMDGETALQFARSRHGVVTDGSGGYEGSDFARAKRQQKILQAIKKRLFSVYTAINPKVINDLLGAVGDHARTNIQPSEMLLFADIAKNYDTSQLNSAVLEHGDDGLLYSSRVGGAYVLLPKDSTFDDIKSFVSNIFSSEEEIAALEEEKAAAEPLSGYVLNGTSITGLAGRYETRLKSSTDAEILGRGNALKKPTQQTIIYYKDGERSSEMAALFPTISPQLEEISSFASLTTDTVPEGTDFVVVLGLDAE